MKRYFRAWAAVQCTAAAPTRFDLLLHFCLLQYCTSLPLFLFTSSWKSLWKSFVLVQIFLGAEKSWPSTLAMWWYPLFLSFYCCVGWGCRAAPKLTPTQDIYIPLPYSDCRLLYYREVDGGGVRGGGVCPETFRYAAMFQSYLRWSTSFSDNRPMFGMPVVPCVFGLSSVSNQSPAR